VNEDHILVGRFLKNCGAIDLRLQDNDDYLTTFGVVLAVADGIGGEAGGATASRLALSAFDTQFYGSGKSADDLLESARTAIKAAAARANQTLLDAAAHRPELTSMGCTLAGICLTAAGYLVFNAGDSRVYRFRQGALRALTQDDSLVGLAVRSGCMTEEEAAVSSRRGAILNCLGSSNFTLTVQPGPRLIPGDILMVCSDGIHGVLSHERIEGILTEGRSVEAALNRLFDEAVHSGTDDNVSAILIGFTSCTEEPAL